MIPSQCMMLLAQAGVSEKPIEMKLKVLQWMSYYVKPAYGLSSTSFWNMLPCLVLSILQGSSEVCPTWYLSSSVQFDVMDDQYPMAVFPSPHPKVYMKCNGKSLIDDVTLWETSATASLSEVAQTMNSKAQAWECGVHVAGAGHWICSTPLFCSQLEISKEWPTCYTNCVWQSWYWNPLDARQCSKPYYADYSSRGYYRKVHSRSSSGTKQTWQDWVWIPSHGNN
jgi:hypothetical protein